MTREAQLLAEELLRHQEQMRKDILITYKSLCTRAGVPFNRATVGGFLCEIAAWCVDNKLPPINALVVRKGQREPGYNYENAPGGDAPWPETVGKCLTSKYPSKISHRTTRN